MLDTTQLNQSNALGQRYYLTRYPEYVSKRHNDNNQPYFCAKQAGTMLSLGLCARGGQGCQGNISRVPDAPTRYSLIPVNKHL
jgi:hypothetical protein